MPWRRRRSDDDFRREVEAHLDLEADRLRAGGLSEAEARTAARRAFGNVTAARERFYESRRIGWLDGLRRDTSYAVRTLRRNPGFAAAAVLTLALGIGANTAVFSAIDAILLRPLPFPAADRLVWITQTQERNTETNIAPVRLEDWNRLSSTFDGMTGYFVEDDSDTSGDLPESVRLAWVAPRFIDVWGIAPALGRGFTAADHQDGAALVAVISDRYWRARLEADPHVLGRVVGIRDRSYSIVGVMPVSFRFPDRDVDLWLPRLYQPFTQSRLLAWYIGVGRLKPGVSMDRARADLALVQTGFAEQYPDTDRQIGVGITSLKERIVSGVGGTLWLLFGAVSVLLLIACTNIAALLLARAVQRQREVEVRISLGASPLVVARQIMTETAVLASAGAAAGLLVAAGATAVFRRLSGTVPGTGDVVLDGRILVYTLACTVAVTLLCGLLPSLRGARAGALTGAGRTVVSSRHATQWTLVGVQVALSVTLLAGAGLLLRSFHELSRVDLGFEASRVLAFRVTWSWNETGDMTRLRQQIDGIVDGLRALPDVEAAAAAASPPGVPTAFDTEFVLAERAGSDRRVLAGNTVVSPGYFGTMRIPVVAGKLCRQQPFGAPWAEVMVNRRFVERYLSGSSPMGMHFVPASSGAPLRRIVGVVGDARERGIDRDPMPMVYHCAHPAQPFRVFLVRTHGEPLEVAHAVRLKIKELEPLRSVYDLAPLEDWIGDTFVQDRLRAAVLTSFAVTALSLAAVGLYGTLSYVVSLRRREIGLRLVLGALRRDIAALYLLRGMRVAGLACAGGLVLSLALGRLLSGMLFGVSPYDSVTLAAVASAVLVVAALAAVVPATRAALVEPVRVLHEE